MRTLIPCSECARHVRSTETACPFCDRPLTPSVARALDPTSRLGRAAMFAFRATTVAALSALPACGDDRTSPPTTTVKPPSTEVPFDPTLVQPYGAPPEPRPEPPPPPPTTAVPSAPESHAGPHHPPASVHALYGAAAPDDGLGERSGLGLPE